MIVAPQDQFSHEERPFRLFDHSHNLLNMLIKKLPKVAEAATKLNFLFLPTQNTNPSKNLILHTMTRFPI